MNKTTTIRVNSEVIQRLKTLCDREGYSMSFVANRLFERFLNGDFSGSLADVVRVKDTEE